MCNIYYKLLGYRYEIRWAYQRVKYGFDERAYWDLGEYLSPIINKVTFKLYEECSSHPNKFTMEEWKDILSKISFGFGSYIEMTSGIYEYNDPEYKRLEKEFERGLKLFTKCYQLLWD